MSYNSKKRKLPKQDVEDRHDYYRKSKDRQYMDVNTQLSDLMHDTHGELCAKILCDHVDDMMPYSTIVDNFIDPETGQPVKEEK